jgi:hypothetical protein
MTTINSQPAGGLLTLAESVAALPATDLGGSVPPLSGYPNRDESVHDLVENSHASTRLS